ncbi:4-diphosphocytidyl-2-C-methyl-D-erythritolkinase [Streptococcus pyogenes]|nr:4-diphosphocytidyl-2C-methyl-D-erythritol kinase [Streptococcus pyogenes]VHF06338.1 4-diphosphocytidyl-2-C-methyl-D-erythritolkinase [Streptococcus pyogenes]
MSTTHLVAAIEADNYNDGILTEMNNLLEDIFIAKRLFIQKIKEKTLQAGAATTLMTGSGPTVFALYQTEKQTIIV